MNKKKILILSFSIIIYTLFSTPIYHFTSTLSNITKEVNCSNSQQIDVFHNAIKYTAKAAESEISLGIQEKTMYIKEKFKIPLENVPAKTQIEWSSKDPLIASVSQKGNITAISEGKTEISCTLIPPDKKQKILKALITVKKPPVKEIKITIEEAILLTEKTKQLKVKIQPSYAEETNIIWKSDNSSIAKVSSTGLVTAVSSGTCKVTAETTKGLKTSCRIIVNEKKIPPTIEELSFKCDGDFIPGEVLAEIKFSLNKSAQEVNAEILNSEKQVVHTIKKGKCEAKSNILTWDGKDGKGKYVPQGKYSVRINADGRKKKSSSINLIKKEDFKKGNGSKKNPYRISTSKELQNVGNYNGRCFLQTSDLDLSNTKLQPLFSSKKKFSGTYDGGDYTIKNLKLNSGKNPNIALFAGIGKDGTVKNINLKSCVITGGNYTAGLAGQNLGTIENCKVSGFIHGDRYVAGISGYNKGSITKCSSLAIITGNKTGKITIDIIK